MTEEHLASDRQRTAGRPRRQPVAPLGFEERDANDILVGGFRSSRDLSVWHDAWGETQDFGNFYPLVPVTNRAGDWCVLQYHLPAKDEGMILAFRRHEASAAEMTLSVREIAPTASYEVTQSQGYERLPPVRFQGPALQQMRVAIPERPGSVLIEYRRIGG